MVQKQPVEVFLKKDFLKHFTKSRKTSEACNFIKKETPAKVFPMNIVKFSRTPFLQNTSPRHLLFLIYLTVWFSKEVLYICKISEKFFRDFRGFQVFDLALIKSWFVVPTTQMPIFVLFVIVGFLFEDAFSLWVSLNYIIVSASC